MNKLSIIVRAIDKATQPVRGIARNINRVVGKPLRGIANEARKVNNAFQKIRLNSGLDRSLSVLKKSLFGISAAAAAAAGAVAGIFIKTSNEGDAIAKNARAIGLGAEAYQELQFAADRSGASQEQFVSGTRGFVKRLGEMKNGTGGLFTLLKESGPQTKAALEAASNNEDALMIMLRSIREVKDEASRTALASAAFGGGASTGFVNLALAGDEAIDAMRQQKREFGVLTQQQVEQAEAAVDAQTNLSESLKGLRQSIGAAVSPKLTEFIDNLTAKIIKAKPQISALNDRLVDIIPTVDQVIRAVSSFADGFRSILDTFQPVIDYLGGPVQTVLLLVAGVIAAPIVTAVASLGIALIGVGSAILKLGALMLTNPLILSAILIAGAVTLIYKNWDGITAYFSEKWASVREAFEKDWLQGVVEALKAFDPVAILLDALGAVAKMFIEDVLGVEGVGEWVDSLTETLKLFSPLRIITNTIESVRALFSGLDFGVEIGSWIDGMSAKISTFSPLVILKDRIKTIRDYFTGLDFSVEIGAWVERMTGDIEVFSPLDMIASAIKDVRDYFSTLDLSDAGRKAWATLTAPLNAILDAAKALIAKLPESIKDMLGLGDDLVDATVAPGFAGQRASLDAFIASGGQGDGVAEDRRSVARDAQPTVSRSINGHITTEVSVKDDRTTTRTRIDGDDLRPLRPGPNPGYSTMSSTR